MPFGIGKTEKRPENDSEGEANPEEAPTASEDAPSAEGDERVEDGNGPFDGSSSGDGQLEESAPYKPMAFRPAFLNDAEPGEGAPAAPPAGEVPDGDAFFVSVTKDGNTEVHLFSDPSRVRAFVEELLETGVPQEHVTAFSGRRLALHVNHRPVVRLVTGQED